MRSKDRDEGQSRVGDSSYSTYRKDLSVASAEASVLLRFVLSPPYPT